ncbi:ATP-grasp domain-containing protein [Saccharothrix coeruleofusca]|nr:ATP-grasp domain-containing protein [Saccharothrix coeruleofusca]
MTLLLLPCDVLNPRRVDEHFAAEAEAARAAGLEVALVDHDALARSGDADRAVRRVPEGGEAVYRGWMLRAERYAAFAEALRRRGVVPKTGAEQYRRAHELPGWYRDLAAVTPRSAWTGGDDRADFDRARRELGAGPAVLRDYTKSMKHYWHEAAFIPELGDGDAACVTVDLALREDGAWRVVELGDGQVSDRPASIPPAALIDLLREL